MTLFVFFAASTVARIISADLGSLASVRCDRLRMAIVRIVMVVLAVGPMNVGFVQMPGRRRFNGRHKTYRLDSAELAAL
jgi:hypothetical protein